MCVARLHLRYNTACSTGRTAQVLGTEGFSVVARDNGGECLFISIINLWLKEVLMSYTLTSSDNVTRYFVRRCSQSVIITGSLSLRLINIIAIPDPFDYNNVECSLCSL